ncbi:MAG: S16 family serine protease, partial [Nocardioidaceae bacterium]
GKGPAAGIVKSGDHITAVDGKKIGTPQDAVDAVSSVSPGTKVDLRIERYGKVKNVAVTTGSSKDDKDKARIGVTLSTDFEFPFTITNTIGENIGGPSAGTIFALAIYDKLTPGSLTDGRAVAGTGEITGTGNVLPIGGIQQKIAGAAAAGAKTFLVPSGNCAEARSGDDFGLELLEVKTLKQAVSSLKATGDDPDAKVPTCN